MHGISCVTEQLLSCGKQRGVTALIDLVKRKKNLKYKYCFSFLCVRKMIKLTVIIIK